MAIPNRTTIICPSCNTSQDVTIGDSSVGPGGRISDVPIYSMSNKKLWTQSRRGGETYLTCNTCKESEFISLSNQAKRRQAPAKPKAADT